MEEKPLAEWRGLLGAVAFAARAHHGQLRKDGETPYVSHVFRACLIVREATMWRRRYGRGWRALQGQTPPRRRARTGVSGASRRRPVASPGLQARRYL